ncbi:hypothetical protein FRC14_007303 [Serendipita sp. 396]|nr:hypothetical protein FRC14_007303 [Serendipita sp. 396]KAG8782557.1 hypothetical protein FRC15_006777 [Serendipita sp. 397]KAG8798294.1 hypothetical protein FRC16_007513 [Serendipita sp. 398]KAG8823158.1 hypothetical protein FRC18_010806 [Serendipita sp. 400]KAG8825434.1 hypothetical protein FRC19_011430 [Serendipita sp. 401]KAG8851307.1 hypothetical protein FRB91_008074 [Serendipita sp. 411]KAG8863885.1 hypothetical protein FRC20_010486 [Serendipita sp. 405]KAG9055798.1 hypothetical prot
MDPVPSGDLTVIDTNYQPNEELSISTTFYPREDYPGDLFLITNDNVYFVVHKRVLFEHSSNKFGGYLDDPALSWFQVPESSTILNLILHVLYDFDPSSYKPTLAQISILLDTLPLYGVDVIASFSEGKNLFKITLDHSLVSGLETYALVCKHSLEVLAVKCSHNLLSTPLYSLTDEHCISMGPIYLRRLVFLHLGRLERLRSLLKPPPKSHTPSLLCDALDQRTRLEKPWKEAVNELCWDLRADTPLSQLQSILGPLVEKLQCGECQLEMKERIRGLFVDWTMVKTTI